MDRGKALIIGIVGGIASGKSSIADQFARQGATVISADALAHEVLQYDNVKRALGERWGEGVLGDDGQVNRAAVAKIVFAPPPDGPRELEYLEQLIHPEVRRLTVERLEAIQRDATVPAVVLDVPLLVERGWDRHCDRIVYVDASRQERLARARRRGWNEEEFLRREAAQQSLAVKRNQADVVIDNSGSPEQSAAQIEKYWRRLIDESTSN